MKFYTWIFFALSFYVFTAEAQVNFTASEGPTGASIGDIEITSGGIIYVLAGTQNGGGKPVAGTVYRSSDNGSNWTKLSGSNGLTDFDAYDILIDADNNIYVLGKTKIYRSPAASNGTTWVVHEPGAPFSGGGSMAKTTDGELYVVNTTAGVFRSTDDGENWANVVSNLPSTNYKAIATIGNDVYVSVLNNGTYRAVDPSSDNPLWVGFNGGISLPDQPGSFMVKGSTLYQSNRSGVYYHDGLNWIQIADDSDFTSGVDFNSFDHTIFNGEGDRIYLTFHTGPLYYFDSTTGGAWPDVPDVNVSQIYDVVTSGSLFLIGYANQGMRVSTNSGSSWSSANKGIYQNYTTGFVRTADGSLITADGGSLLQYSEYGTTWVSVVPDVSCTNCGFSDLVKLNNGEILAIGNEIYKSVDQGVSWTYYSTPPEYFNKSFTVDDNTFYAYKNNYPDEPGWYISVNGALNWSEVTLTGLPSDYELRNFVMDASNNFYVLLYNTSQGEQELYMVPEGTTTASEITNLGFAQGIENVRYMDNAIYVLGRNASNQRQIARSIDAGANWTKKNVPDMNDFYPVSSDIMIGVRHEDDMNHVLYTNDAGSTWKTAFDESVQAYLLSSVLDENGYLTIAFSRAPVYRSDANVVRPVAPTNLQVVATGESEIFLEWDHNGVNVNNFMILKRVDGEVAFDTLTDGESAQSRYYRVYGLTKNTDYDFRVIALSTAGNSAPASVSASTSDDCELTIPDNRSWTGTVGSFTNPVIGIKKYNGNLYAITDVTAGSLEDVAKNAGGTFGETEVATFFYENCGEPFIDGEGDVLANGNGSWDGTTLTLHFQIDKAKYTPTELTIELTLNSEDPAPGAPLNPIAYVYDNSSVKLEWQSNLYQKTYEIFRSTTEGFTPSAANKIGAATYPEVFFIDDDALAASTTYYYRVRALNGDPVPEASPFASEVSVVFAKPLFVPSGTIVSGTSANAPTAAWADFNNDGLEDLLMPVFSSGLNSGDGALLFQNTGTGFELLSGKFPTGVPYVTPSVGDYDNDGLTDIYMAAIQFDEDDEIPAKYSLFRNTGDFNFVEQSASGPSQSVQQGAFTSSWVDFDNNGALDLFVVNQLPDSRKLFSGDGNGGFTEVSSSPLATDNLWTTYAGWTDLDKNGYQDVLLLSNEGGEGDDDAFRMFMNIDGTFSKVEFAALNQDDDASTFTCSWGDYDNDLDMDLFVGDQDGAGLLYRNNGNETFTKLSAVADTPTETSAGQTFGSAWGDLDNDGDLDLVVTKGFLAGNCIYLNQGNGNFTKVRNELITDAPGFHLSASLADYDQDGFLDLLVGQLVFAEGTPAANEPTIKLMKNNNTTGNWVQIKLRGTASNASAIGARIVVTTGATSRMREVISHTGFGGQNSLIAHFGLGTATTIDNIQVIWPSGAIQNIPNQATNQIIEITEDAEGPAASVLTPANNATNVSTATQISITLDEESTPVADKLLLLYLHSDLSTPIDGLKVDEADHVDNTYTFTLGNKLLPGTQYNISVDAGAFVDRYGNSSLEFPTGLWTFTTAPVPSTSGLSPEHEDTGVALNVPLVITFDAVMEPVAGKLIKVMDGTTEVLNVDVSATGDIASTTTTTYTLTPVEKWPAGKILTITVDAGAFLGTVSQAEFAGITAGAWTFTTASAPGFTLSPAHDETEVPVNAALEITFDKVVEAVAGKKLIVMDGATTLVDLDISMAGTLESTSNSSTYTFEPEADWPVDKTLKVTVDPGAFMDPDTQAEFEGVALDGWNFTTVSGPDETGPSISFVQSQVPQTLESGFAALPVSITVIDDTDVESVSLWHRKISAENFTEVSLIFNQTTDVWEGQITNAISDDMGFEYYFEATDPSDNIGRFPIQEDSYLKSTISYVNDPPVVQLPTGGTKTSWKVISIPYVLQSTQISTVFSALGDASRKDLWRLIRYAEDPAPAWKEYPTHFSTIDRGKGYFINTKDISSLTIEDASAPTNTRDDLFAMALTAGWNQVGNPYTVAINWEDVRSFNETVAIGEIKIFNSGSYTNGDELVPFQGGFVFVEAPATVQIPFKGQTAGGRRGVRDLSNNIDTDDWMVSFKLKQGELQYDLGAVGMALDASDSYDRYDDVTPPRFVDYLEVNFAHPEHRAGRFTRDITATDDNHTWTFDVQSNQEGEAQLRWDQTIIAGAMKEIYLLDVGRQVLVNMKEKGSYAFSPKESATFKVIFGNNLEIAPEAVHLGMAYPNPTSGPTVMGFSLPRSGGYNQSVSFEIVDITGKKVGVVAQGYFDPGYHELTWNARVLNNGFYTYRLIVQGENGKTVKTNKLIIK